MFGRKLFVENCGVSHYLLLYHTVQDEKSAHLHILTESPHTAVALSSQGSGNIVLAGRHARVAKKKEKKKPFQMLF